MIDRVQMLVASDRKQAAGLLGTFGEAERADLPNVQRNGRCRAIVLQQLRGTFMSNAGPADLSNPYLPPKADLTEAWSEGRRSFVKYRRACLGHETFQRCVGLADLICAWLGTPIVAGRAWALISMLRSGFALSRLEMIEWVVGNFVFLPALIWLLMELGLSLPRRLRWAWRMQIFLSVSVLLFMVVRWTLFRPHPSACLGHYFRAVHCDRTGGDRGRIPVETGPANHRCEVCGDHCRDPFHDPQPRLRADPGHDRALGADRAWSAHTGSLAQRSGGLYSRTYNMGAMTPGAQL